MIKPILIFVGDLFHWVLYDEVSNDLAYNNSNKQGLVDWVNDDTLTFTGNHVIHVRVNINT